MAHKTLIGGTAYEISGGKTLIDGTAFSIKNGKTLIGGTVYEVGFAKPIITFYLYRAYTDYDGINYKGLSSYTAEEGMTWIDWRDSEYGDLQTSPSDTGFSVTANEVSYRAGYTSSYRVYNDKDLSDPTLGTDVIIANGRYYGDDT